MEIELLGRGDIGRALISLERREVDQGSIRVSDDEPVPACPLIGDTAVGIHVRRARMCAHRRKCARCRPAPPLVQAKVIRNRRILVYSK